MRQENKPTVPLIRHQNTEWRTINHPFLGFDVGSRNRAQGRRKK
jgi:hypothetical protein